MISGLEAVLLGWAVSATLLAFVNWREARALEKVLREQERRG